MKYILLTLLFAPFFLENPYRTDMSSFDLNELIVHTELILLAKVADMCNGEVDDNTVQFTVEKVLKGTSDESLFVNSSMLYKGDLPESIRNLSSFQQDDTYIIFLQKHQDKLILMHQYTLQEYVDSDEEVLISINSNPEEISNPSYVKSSFIHAIESFVYNEIEILESEILASHMIRR